MTAWNAFARDDGAWLIADTGGFHADGRVLRFQSKIVANKRLNLAITQAGRLETNAVVDIADWLDSQPDQRTALAGLPNLLRRLVAFDQEAQANGAAKSSGDHPEGIKLAVAAWNHESQKAAVVIVASTTDLGVPPFAPRRTKTVFSPTLSHKPWPGHSFEPCRHAQTLARLQRAERFHDDTCRVAGEMEAVRVGPRGIEWFTICKWPDRVGRKVAQRPSLASRALAKAEAVLCR